MDVTRRHFLQSVAASVGVPALLGQPNHAVLAASPGAAPAVLPTALVWDNVYKLHATEERCPDQPSRVDAILAALRKGPGFSALVQLKPRPADDEEICLCHRETYLERVRRQIEAGSPKLHGDGTSVCRESLRVARNASGAGLAAVDALMAGQVRNAFCPVRPPGHHAGPHRNMGFCIFNNAAIAARYAQKKHGLGKVLIVDWDVHHGNGTQDIFYEDGSVFYFSTHQDPWYPETGARDETGHGKGLGTTLNCPLPQGAGRKEVFAAYQDELAPAVDRFKPELIVISAGFDSRRGDPLGQFQLVDEDFADLTGLVLEMARHHAGSRVVSMLEGGYNLRGLGSAAVAHCARLQQG